MMAECTRSKTTTAERWVASGWAKNPQVWRWRRWDGQAGAPGCCWRMERRGREGGNGLRSGPSRAGSVCRPGCRGWEVQLAMEDKERGELAMADNGRGRRAMW